MRVAFAGGKDAAAGPDAHFVVQTAKKNSHFCAKSRKQRIGIFLAS